MWQTEKWSVLRLVTRKNGFCVWGHKKAGFIFTWTLKIRIEKIKTEINQYSYTHDTAAFVINLKTCKKGVDFYKRKWIDL